MIQYFKPNYLNDRNKNGCKKIYRWLHQWITISGVISSVSVQKQRKKNKVKLKSKENRFMLIFFHQFRLLLLKYIMVFENVARTISINTFNSIFKLSLLTIFRFIKLTVPYSIQCTCVRYFFFFLLMWIHCVTRFIWLVHVCTQSVPPMEITVPMCR